MKKYFLFSLFVFTGFFTFGQYREIITIAGSSETGAFGGDGGKGDSALLSGPNDAATDIYGNIYIEDFYNFRIRKVNTLGYISTFAGSGSSGYSGVGGYAASANMYPNGVTTDKFGNVYISDNGNNIVWKVNATTSLISLYAGWPGHPGFYGDSGLAPNRAMLNGPKGMCFDAKGNLYIADVNNHRVRKVDDSGKIWTFAGNGTPLYAGDGGKAIYASIDSPVALAADSKGNIYIADYHNCVVRKVDTGGIITTYAGIYPFWGYSGDGGPATNAAFRGPKGIAVDKFGNLYVSDEYNFRVRMVDTTGTINTYAGIGSYGFSGDGGNALYANLMYATGICTDTFCNLYICDANNQRVRKVFNPFLSISKVFVPGSFDVYPNPSGDYINFNQIASSDRVVVCDLMGKVVLESSGVPKMDIGGLNTGLYLVRLIDENGNLKSTTKFVKQ